LRAKEGGDRAEGRRVWGPSERRMHLVKLLDSYIAVAAAVDKNLSKSHVLVLCRLGVNMWSHVFTLTKILISHVVSSYQQFLCSLPLLFGE
jgi:hypothetical protein